MERMVSVLSVLCPSYCHMLVYRPWALKYAEDEKLFFSEYVKAHLKLSELGSEWQPDAPFTLDI